VFQEVGVTGGAEWTVAIIDGPMSTTIDSLQEEEYQDSSEGVA